MAGLFNRKQRKVLGRIFQLSISTVSLSVGDYFDVTFSDWIRIHKITTQANYTVAVIFRENSLVPYLQYNNVSPGNIDSFPLQSIGASNPGVGSSVAINSPNFVSLPAGNSDFVNPITTKSFRIHHYTTGIKVIMFYYDFLP